MKLSKKYTIGIVIIGALLAGAAIVAWHHAERGVLPSNTIAPLANSQGSILADSSRSVSVSARMNNKDVEVVLHIKKGWHVNANPATLEGLIPTTVTVLNQERPLQAVAHYPAGHDGGIAIDGKTILVYEDMTRIPVSVTQTETPTRVRVKVQACNDQGICLPPADVATGID
ncbi:protein-disulfide reductase DsbD domain-containing protein [Eoetvoesiella caeni]